MEGLLLGEAGTVIYILAVGFLIFLLYIRSDGEEEVMTSGRVYDGFHKVDILEVEVRGSARKVEKLGIKSAVGAILLDGEGKMGLVKQYRPCIGDYLYEIPAGLMDKEGKSHRETLIEEIEEECGVPRSAIIEFSDEPVFRYYMVCGSSDAEMAIYCAKLSTIEKTHAVDDADVEEVVWLTMKELEIMNRNGLLKDPKTILAYQFVKPSAGCGGNCSCHK